MTTNVWRCFADRSMAFGKPGEQQLVFLDSQSSDFSAVKAFHYLMDRERPDQSKVDQTQRHSVPGDWNHFLAAAIAAIS